jgi:hypothetical protein
MAEVAKKPHHIFICMLINFHPNDNNRQILNLPIRVAASIQKQKNFDPRTINSPFSMIFAKVAAREAVEARHSVPLEKV